MTMSESLLRRIGRELMSPWPEKQPKEFKALAMRLLFARHLAEYEWALPNIDDGVVLDLGSNWGQGLQILAQKARVVVGAEICLEIAQESRRITGKGVVQANGQALPFPDGTFDCVVSVHVIEHVWDDVSFVREVRRILKPGGRFVVSTPHQPNSLFVNENPEFDEHLREYLPEELKDVLGTCFSDVEVKGVFGDTDSDDIERRRAWRRPELYYFPGVLQKPIRAAIRLVRKLFRRGRKFTKDEIEELSNAETDRALTKHFFLETSGMERAHHLIAFCRKSEASELPHVKSQCEVSDVIRARRERLARRQFREFAQTAVILNNPWPTLADVELVSILGAQDAEYLVVADGPTERRIEGGIRARSINHWRQLFAAAGFEIVDTSPIEGFVDVLRGQTGLVRRVLDIIVLPFYPWLARCCLILAKRTGETPRASQFVSGESQHQRPHNVRAIAEVTRN